MKTLLLSVFLTLPAHADFGPMPAELPTGYECDVPANPERGLPISVTIKLKGPDAEGAMAVTSANGQERALGFVSKIETLEKNKPEHEGAFQLTLGMFHEQDVSGLAPADVNKVSSIRAYEIDHPTTEVKLFRFFGAKNQQLGGSILLGGMGTRCLPKK